MTRTARLDRFLFAGDLAPWFRHRCVGEADPFSFDMAAGRAVLLGFLGSHRDALAREALDLIEAEHALFDGVSAAFIGVTNDPRDLSDPVLSATAGMRHVADIDRAIARAYGVAADGSDVLRRLWYVLDRRLRIVAVLPFTEGRAAIESTRELARGGPMNDTPPPVLVIPGVFEPAFRERLIAFHAAGAGIESSILTERPETGTATIADAALKRRRDVAVTDPALVAQIQTRVFRRVVPELRHAFQFGATRLERLILACYDASEGGHFAPHRDNTLAATAHRRFAVSINLNDDFDGGDLVFPEYGARRCRPPAGGALVFSCSLLHAVTPVMRGRRHACLPFVYDEAAAKLWREGASTS